MRRRLAAMAVVAATAGVLVVALLLNSAEPTMPPADATPDAVLDAYLRAEQAGDCATAQSLVLPGQSVVNLCGNVASWTPFRVANTANIGIEYHTVITTVRGSPPFPAGDYGWNFSLGQQGDGAWRLTGSGTGP